MRLLVLDIDGVLTDGRVALDQRGEETKRLCYRDIDAVFQARGEGMQVALITGERSPMVQVIADRLAIETVVSGAKDKAAALREACDRLGVPLSETCYVGDADRDGAALAIAGLGLAPSGASDEACRRAHRVLSARGGNGAVAEAVALTRAWNARERGPSAVQVTAGGIEEAIALSLNERIALTQALVKSMAPQIATVAAWAIETFRGGGKLLLFGDGGSAADAQRIAAEFLGRSGRERRPWLAIALGTEPSVRAASGDDSDLEHIYARQVEALGRPGDLVLVFSAGGSSPNVINGAVAARMRGLRIVGLTGQDGGRLAPICDLALRVPSRRPARIREGHVTVCHAVCEVVEDALASVESGSGG